MHERARLEIEEGAQKLETLMIDAVDRNFDRLEIWTLRNVLCLPKEEGFENWVRLGHYEVCCCIANLFLAERRRRRTNC